MNILALRYFVAVAESGNVTKVAQELFVSQPTISKTLHSLESELGCVLFEHRKGKITLNHEGKRFYTHARRVLDELDDGMNELKQINHQEVKQIRVGSTIYDFLSEVSAKYLSTHMDITLKQYFYSHHTMRQKLMNNELHFGISSRPMEGLPWEPLLHSPLVMHIPENHPAGRKPTAKLSDFRNDAFVVNSMGMDVEMTTRLCQEAGFTPLIVLDSNEALSAGSVLKKTACVSICSADSIYSQHPIYGLIDDMEEMHPDWKQKHYSSVLLEGLEQEHSLGLIRRVRDLNPECEQFYGYVKQYLVQKDARVMAFVKKYYMQG